MKNKEFDVAAARETLRRRREERCRKLERLETDAATDAAAIIRMLIERYRPRRIYQWGSLTRAGAFREWSDIDIALEGLEDPLDGLRAMDDAAQLTRFPVDLVELERIDPRHAADIRDRGVLVYECT